MIRPTQSDGVSAMVSRLLKSLSAVVLILVLSSTLSLAGVGFVSRGEPSRSYQSSRASQVIWSLLLSVSSVRIA